MEGELLWWEVLPGRTAYWHKPPERQKVGMDDVIGVAGESNPDGSVPVILNDHGRRVFGNIQLVILPPEPAADQPIIVGAQ